MALTVGAEALGTSEAAWSTCARLERVAPWDGAPRVRSMVVVAPHPDDETLATGGLLALLAARGVAITLVAVTDGEASHPRSPTVSRSTLAARRRREREAALDRLGVHASVVELHVPDGHVAATASLDRALVAHVAGADLCVAPLPNDGHPDHDAAGASAARAAGATGITILHYPLWAWHWARPNTDDLPWDRALRVPLDGRVAAAKARAIASYASQIAPLSGAAGDEPILPAPVLERFRRPFEILFR